MNHLLRSAHSFEAGARIKVNALCGIEALRGATGTVIDATPTKVHVKLDEPVGRFFELIDSLIRATTIAVTPMMLDAI